MSTFTLRRFSHADTLKRIGDRYLIELLSPHQAFLAQRGFNLPTVEKSGEIDHETLAHIFMKPGVEMPKNLCDALYYIDELSSTEMMDKMMEAAEKRGIDLDLGPEPAPADVAVRLWLRDHTTLEEIHAESYLTRPRSFLYFATTKKPVPPLVIPTQETLTKMEAYLDDWFEEKKRGRGCRIFVYPDTNECWFLVRHSEPLRREGSIYQGQTGSVLYHPQQHDVLIYNIAIGEIRIHAGTKGERNLYRRCLGHYLFKDEGFFPDEGIYTLEPLIKLGPDSMSVQGVENYIEWIVMKELVFGWGAETEIRKGENLFASFQKRLFTLTENMNLLRAVFSVKFRDSEKPRSVTIEPTNKAKYDRDHDSSVIETWLKLRGFIEEDQAEDETERSMADAGTVAVA